MAVQSAVQSVKTMFRELEKHRTEHQEKLEAMPAEERKAENTNRLEEYKALCLCGAIGMLWKDTYSMNKKLHEHSRTAAGMTSMFSLVAFFSIVLGLAASTFSRTAPNAMAIAGNGGLWSMLFVIMVCHLEMMDFLPVPLLIVLCVLLLVTFTGYWYYCGRELRILLMVLKFMLNIIFIVFKAFIGIFRYIFVKIKGLFKRSNQRVNEDYDGFPLHDFGLPQYYSTEEMIWRQDNNGGGYFTV